MFRKNSVCRQTLCLVSNPWRMFAGKHLLLPPVNCFTVNIPLSLAQGIFSLKMFAVKQCSKMRIVFAGKHMTQKSETGKLGEDIAAEYLTFKGYKILDRNYRKTFGEIDILAWDKNKILVFVEVKTIRQSLFAGLKPEDNLTKAKLEKMKRMAQMFAGKHSDLMTDRGWRIDLVAVTMFAGKQPEIAHYENIA